MKNIDFTDFFNVFLSGATIGGAAFLYISGDGEAFIKPTKRRTKP